MDEKAPDRKSNFTATVDALARICAPSSSHKILPKSPRAAGAELAALPEVPSGSVLLAARVSGGARRTIPRRRDEDFPGGVCSPSRPRSGGVPLVRGPRHAEYSPKRVGPGWSGGCTVRCSPRRVTLTPHPGLPLAPDRPARRRRPLFPPTCRVLVAVTKSQKRNSQNHQNSKSRTVHVGFVKHRVKGADGVEPFSGEPLNCELIKIQVRDLETRVQNDGILSQE
ncbi:hypothetical protein EYF80_037468 [Liparis tanakae]|uniref:Uncharacterized protein n=1 Tax=Liparis tanakae TaxID=230148 RepID=A0A4Z2GHT0_9TELE|nr:hypothetical protein EYF80_037468 [Liparis tanakae]